MEKNEEGHDEPIDISILLIMYNRQVNTLRSSDRKLVQMTETKLSQSFKIVLKLEAALQLLDQIQTITNYREEKGRVKIT